jgi:predicted AlkP superfamily phosphohydrolase/phosphomutase
LTGGKVELLRKGKAFWEILAANGIPTSIFGIPANFPPVESEARSLSGMGTPDIQGTYGIFSFYTDDPPQNSEEISGGEIFPVRVVNHRVKAKLHGPINVFRKSRGTAKIDFLVRIDPENPVAKVVIQGKEVLLNEGEWSDWVEVDFPLIPFLKSSSGICRFYLKETHPHFKLYVSPINLDPLAPGLPISTPPSYTRRLAKAVGRFYTQGMPEDTKAYNAGILNEKEFIAQSRIVLAEREAILDYELKRFRTGLLFFYFFAVDPISHMFWWAMDPDHPAREQSGGSSYANAVDEVYQEMDRVLGRVLAALDQRTTLIVMSDHGFAPFYRHFNLNTWLRDNGYLAHARDRVPGAQNLLTSVDWARTRAYGIGLNGLYLNLRGREPEGTVSGDEKEGLMDEISRKLLDVRDPFTGRQVIFRVYKSSEVFSGAHAGEGPDLIVGYNRGFRASNKTALGEIPEELFGDNIHKWSGDHAMAAELVPGVVLSNRKIKAPDPALADLTVTILAEFGIKPLKGMKGKSIF